MANPSADSVGSRSDNDDANTTPNQSINPHSRSRHHDRNHCDPQDRCRWNWCYPGFAFLYVGGYGYGWAGNYGGYYDGAYGTTSPFDPNYAQLAQQNAELQAQVVALQQRLEELDPDAKPVNLKLKAKNRKPIANDPGADKDAIEQSGKARETERAGMRLFETGGYRRAADKFRAAIKIAPKDATPRFYLAQSLFAQGKYSEAASAIKEGLKLNPEWLELDFDLRQLYGNAEDLKPQLAALADEQKAHPLDKDSMFVLGFELFLTGQKEKARALLEQSVRLETDDRHLKPFFDYLDRDR